MNKIPKCSYTKEFRRQAVKLVLSDGLSLPEAARRLSMSSRTLGNWVRAERKGVLQNIGKQQHPQSDLESELARYIGPIAPIVVRAGTKKAATQSRLVELVAAEISAEKDRAAFVKKFAAGAKSTPTGPSAANSENRDNSAPARFDPAILEKAEAALAKHLGAVARVVVRRAAAKARDESELYRLLAEQIEDKDERKAFVRKALSVSGRP